MELKTGSTVIDSLLSEEYLNKDNLMVLLNELSNCNVITQESVLNYLPKISDFSKTVLQQQLREIKQKNKEGSENLNFSVVKQDKGGLGKEEASEYAVKLLAKGEREEATEVIVNYIEENNYIYTTRDDEKSEMWFYTEGIYVPQGKTYVEEIVRNMVGEIFTTYLINQVIAKVEVDTYIEHDNFFNKTYLDIIPVKNGILNIKTKELYDFSPEYVFFSKIPVRFDPEITDCPNIKKFFKEILASSDDLKVIQELFGYCLYDDYFIEKAFMFYGGGRNGKGKTLGLLKNFLGVDNCTEIPLEDLEKDMYSLSELHGKKANICGDLSSTALRHTGNFKKLVGKDFLSAPRKYLTRIKFVNSAKLIFACNELPMAYDISDAFFNRWIILDFPYQFLPREEIEALPEDQKKWVKERDAHILDKITNEDEMSGLLNWALDGLERLLERECFSNSETTERVRKRWLMRSDSCMAFVLLHIEQDFESNLSKKDFREYYAKFCKANNLKISGDKRIRAILESQLGVSDDQIYNEYGLRERVWQGIKLKDVGNIDKQIKRTDDDQKTLLD